MTKILVVDDDSHIRELIRFTLKNEGFEVEEAVNGKQALQCNLVIFDIMMPVMDGWDLCRELRENYDLPLLMVTAKGESEDKVKGYPLFNPQCFLHFVLRKALTLVRIFNKI